MELFEICIYRKYLHTKCQFHLYYIYSIKKIIIITLKLKIENQREKLRFKSDKHLM